MHSAAGEMTMRLPVLTVMLVFTSTVTAQSNKPQWIDAQDLLVRAGGEKQFTKSTPKLGVELYLDPVGKALIAINEAGVIAALPMASLSTDRKTTWVFAHDLRVRKADDDGWKAAKPFGVEAFRYPAAKAIIYVSEQKGLALALMPSQVGSDNPPQFHHGLKLLVRAPGQSKFAEAKTKLGIEAFKDGNTGGLIYVTETGQLACAPAPATAADLSAPKRPTPVYGLEPQVRKAAERDFTQQTKSHAIEVFQDPNSGNLLYLSESGFLATAPAVKVKDGQGLSWSHGMSLKARKGGAKEFTNAASYGIEVFTDKNSGNTLYVCETGSVAVVSKP
jgi:hypothetical protein